jgi:deazaflavin-dependent oxidoreductase (nitroreductase family)
MLRWLFRAPKTLYAFHAGPLLGHRFLLLRHRGRLTGNTHATVLEVLAWDAASREAVVISGFGRRAQWMRNVLAAGAAEIEIARERWPASVRPLGPAEGAAVLAEYERRNRLAQPLLRRLLSRLAGVSYDGTEQARRTVAERLPLVAFTPCRDHDVREAGS